MRTALSGGLRSVVAAGSALAVILMIALAATPATAAVTALTISSTYPSVQVDPGGQVDLPILVQSPQAERVDLSVTGAPDGWKTSFRGGGFTVTSVTTTGSDASPGPTDLKLRVEVPDTATAKAYDMTVHAASGAQTADLKVTLNVANAQGEGVSLTTTVQAKTGTIGSPVTFSVTLHNDTAAELKFSTTVPDAPAGWNITAKPSNDADPNNFSVGGGDTDTITVSATPPSSVTAGDYQFTVVASSGDTNTASLPLGVRLSGSEQLSLVSKSGVLNVSASAGGATTYVVTVTNTGSAPLTNITLNDTPPTDWKVDWSQKTIDALQPDTQVDITATITPPSNAVDGDYIVTLSASSGQADDSIDVRTRVETSSIWGYVGIGLIILVGVALLIVFRQYGRR